MTSDSPKGFYKVRNSRYNVFIGNSDPSDTTFPIAAVSTDSSTAGIFRIVPANGRFLISLVVPPRLALSPEFYVVKNDSDDKIRARLDVLQMWYIHRDEGQNETRFVILDAQYQAWTLFSKTPGTRVECLHPKPELDSAETDSEDANMRRAYLQGVNAGELPYSSAHPSMANTTKKTLWELIEVPEPTPPPPDIKPLEDGDYFIKNFKNGPINIDGEDCVTTDGYRVLGKPEPAKWRIQKKTGWDYTISTGGKSANRIGSALYVGGRSTATIDEWLIHPVNSPDTYLIFDAHASGSGPVHWLLKAPDAQVAVEDHSNKQQTKDDPLTCLWVITPAPL